MSRDGWAALSCGAMGFCLRFVIVVFPDHSHLLFLIGNNNYPAYTLRVCEIKDLIRLEHFQSP